MAEETPQTSGETPELEPNVAERVYDELRRVAHDYLRHERADHTLEATALVHEAFVKLSAHDERWKNSIHYQAVAARAMRQILVDHAKRRNAKKRGGAHLRLTIQDHPAAAGSVSEVDLLELEEAIEELSRFDARKGRVVELRYFGGLTAVQIADILNVSPNTVREDWYFSRVWLRRRLTP